MAHVKMLAYRCLIGAAVIGFFAAGSGIAYEAAGAALYASGYIVHR